MSHWFSNWVHNQQQTRRFHPSYILLVVVVTVIVAGIIWIFAALVTRAEQDDRPPAAELRAPGKTAVPPEEVPAAHDPWTPTRGGPKTVEFSIPATDGIVDVGVRYSRDGNKQNIGIV